MYEYDAQVTRIIDGDTYDVEVDLGFRTVVRLPLRLAHVDAPERFTDRGRLATACVAEFLGQLPARVVVTTYKPVDKYGRYLADVYVPNSGDLATHLIQEGLAQPYEGGTRL